VNPTDPLNAEEREMIAYLAGYFGIANATHHERTIAVDRHAVKAAARIFHRLVFSDPNFVPNGLTLKLAEAAFRPDEATEPPRR
jgi:hypothetical protein